ncbi:hypothetical protein QBC44DRAFT_390445 [Cladorrhinum sp. PSN332]|nr:hypothetical protein QBC44DRAFT_390445 [Cladorrhinum sp. PSN332]
MAAQSQGTGWQPNAHRRGTFDIIESCAITVFACTWTIQHLNVPGKNDGWIRRLLRTCKWMAINVLLPEFILAHAIIEFTMALDTMREMREKGYSNIHVAESPSLANVWRNTRRLYYDESDSDPEAGTVEVNERKQRWTITHAYFANMGGFVREAPPSSASYGDTDTEKLIPVLGTHIAQCLDRFEPLSTTEDDIKDKSKSDTFAKAIAVLQILQLVLSLIVRHFRGLPFAQLEMLTVALAVCGVATWVAFWYKPRSVSVPIKLREAEKMGKSGLESQDVARSNGEKVEGASQDGPKKDTERNDSENNNNNWQPRDYRQVLDKYLRRDRRYRHEDDSKGYSADRSERHLTEMELSRKAFDSFWTVITNRLNPETKLLERVPNDNIPINSSLVGETHSLTYILAFTSAAFGSLHAIAWNFQFPTPVEAMLWRVGTILSVVVPPLGLLAIPISQITVQDGDPREFLTSTIRMLDEFVWCPWQVSKGNKLKYNEARLKLKSILYTCGPQPSREAMVPYRDIFCLDGGEAQHRQHYRLDELLSYIRGYYGDRPEGLPPRYIEQFTALVKLMKGNGNKKMVNEAAKTFVYPRRPMHGAVNLGIVYVTGIVYCIARLMVVAVGLSSLRSMPDGVYVTTWTRYIPSIS